MKNTMKFLMYGLLLSALVFASCSKDGEDGSDGIQGEQGIPGVDGINGSDGIDGEDGINGTDGEDGNANVTIFEYESRTFTRSTIYRMAGVTEAEMAANLVVAFYGTTFTRDIGNNIGVSTLIWKPVPGIDSDFMSTYQVHNSGFFSPGGGSTLSQEMSVSLHTFNGTNYNVEVTFERFKIFMIPPSSVTAKNNNLDFSTMTYKEIPAYLDEK